MDIKIGTEPELLKQAPPEPETAKAAGHTALDGISDASTTSKDDLGGPLFIPKDATERIYDQTGYQVHRIGW